VLVAEVLASKARPRQQPKIWSRLWWANMHVPSTHTAYSLRRSSSLEPEDQRRILEKERAIVGGFAKVVIAIRPDLAATPMDKPLTMLLFGMINWLFTWMRTDGELDYDDMGSVVADLFLNGLSRVAMPSTTRPAT
jgi:hypothetical protein